MADATETTDPALFVEPVAAGRAPSAAEAADAPVAGDVARTAGRGGLAITFAKVYFILQGFAQQVLLPRVLGLDGYGALSSVLSASSITYNPIVTTAIQGVSRSVAQSSEAERPAAVRRVFAVHAVLAVVAAAAFFLAVPWTASFMRAPHIEGALRASSFVLLFYGLYSPLIGVLNGRRRFVAQATFDVAFATARTLALVGGGFSLAREGRGVEGSLYGFVAVAAGVAMVAMLVVGIGRRGAGGPTVRQHVAFILPLLVSQVLLNLLLQADLTLLRRFAGDAAAGVGLSPSAADPLVGAYRATQLYSFLPYQVLVSVTFILFPMLASAHKEGDRAAVARYVATGVRIAMLVSGLIVSVTSGLSGPLLRFVYSAEVARIGTQSMQVLTLGFGAFAILGVLTAALASLGRERSAAAVVAFAFSLVVVACFGWARTAPFGAELVFRTAVSTSAGLLASTVCAAVLVRRVAGSVVAPATLGRVLACGGLAITCGRFLPEGGKGMTLVASVLVAGVYVALLLASRELGASDAAVVRRVFRRRR